MAKEVMKAWLSQHTGAPYPTEEEKIQLADQTKLTDLQIKYWFSNARRRELKVMLESNPDQAKAKNSLAEMERRLTIVEKVNVNLEKTVEELKLDLRRERVNVEELRSKNVEAR